VAPESSAHSACSAVVAAAGLDAFAADTGTLASSSHAAVALGCAVDVAAAAAASAAVVAADGTAVSAYAAATSVDAVVAAVVAVAAVAVEVDENYQRYQQRQTNVAEARDSYSAIPDFRSEPRT